MFGRAMADDVAGDTSGDYKKLLVELCQAERNDMEEPNLQTARELATRLYKAGEEKVGTDENEFISILCQHSFAQLALVLEEYNKVDWGGGGCLSFLHRTLIPSLPFIMDHSCATLTWPSPSRASAR